MYKGIYIVTSGAVLKDKELAVITRNISNAHTSGYKKDTVTFKSYLLPESQYLLPTDNNERVMAQMGEVTSDYSAGTFVKTGNTLDIAIDGEGFIALEGNTYTRRGDFRIDRDGYLVNYQGMKVLGEDNQPIILPKTEVIITNTGDIKDGESSISTLKLVDFQNKKDLFKTADSIYSTTEKPVSVNAHIRQGYLESSNVDPIQEMVKMITTVREFEVFQKMVQAYDGAMAKASNEIAKM